jgi:hypothetical protein
VACVAVWPCSCAVMWLCIFRFLCVMFGCVAYSRCVTYLEHENSEQERRYCYHKTSHTV